MDKHKNFGGNFKNKERSKTNPKIKIIKEFKKQLLTKNLSCPNIYNLINIEDIQSPNNKIINRGYENNFQYANTNAFSNANINLNYNNDFNKTISNRIKNIDIQYNLSIAQDKDNKMKMNPI